MFVNFRFDELMVYLLQEGPLFRISKTVSALGRNRSARQPGEIGNLHRAFLNLVSSHHQQSLWRHLLDDPFIMPSPV